jgi:hypothetical protein
VRPFQKPEEKNGRTLHQYGGECGVKEIVVARGLVSFAENTAYRNTLTEGAN